MRTRYIFLLSLLLFSTVIMAQNSLPLIPKPSEVKMGIGAFKLNKETVIEADQKMFEAQYLQQSIKQKTGLDLKILLKSEAESKIKLTVKLMETFTYEKDKYQITILKDQININSGEDQGLFCGIQTLLQLIPLENTNEFKLPCLEIKDIGKYSWRGMHLDCARHFFPVAFVKKYIDYMAMYKMNTFHWHLTDDQGWRIEIKKYPKLTEIGAVRKGSMVGHYRDQKFDSIPYGGFYTQEDIKEVVAYAKERHITVVPEIEMPGHAVAALAAYPELSCTGGPFEVAQKWGVLEDVFCPKEETFTFLENVLTEVMALFPSQYIHIGGDECPKVRWKNCPHCQALIKSEGLKDEHELQSYFIKRIEKFLNSKGRKIIGWDEILEGGLAPNAAVMSWRGIKGGITAAKEHHGVVMTPSSNCYFDHYQGEPKNEPVAIGGFTPVEKVYGYNPTPAELAPEDAKYILGVQANLWTEYINTPKQAEYMLLPRMIALSEVAWGTSDATNYKDFQDRLLAHFPVLDKMGINYSKAIFDITTKVSSAPDNKGVLFTLKLANDISGVRYTTDGSDPVINSKTYSAPIIVTESGTIKAAYFESEKQKSNITQQAFLISKSTGKPITLKVPPSDSYSVGGAFTLVDGIRGESTKYGRDWLGFSGKDLDAVIDLGKVEAISKVTIDVLSAEGSWIYYPKNIEVLISDNGKDFTSIQQIYSTEINAMKGKVIFDLKQKNVQYIKVIAQNNGKIAEGKEGAGSQAWLFVSEIMVE